MYPDLQSMVALRLVVFLEENQLTVAKQRKTAADDRTLDTLLNHVVQQHHVSTDVSVVKYVQVIFAIDGRDPSFKQQIRDSALKRATLARLQIVTAGKNQAMPFGRRLWVVPSGHPDPPAADAVILRLDPGLAFGTGTHPTTALCLEWLDGLEWQGESLIDFGAGSGILAIAGLRLGAARAIAIDNDPQALVACAANAERNRVGERLQILDAAQAVPTADRLVANILLKPLLALAPQLAGSVANGGAAAFSGLLAEQADEFLARYRPWFDDLKVTQRGDWIRIDGRRSDRPGH